MRNGPPVRECLLTAFVAFVLPAAPILADLDDEIGEATDLGIEFLLKAIEAKQVETGQHDDFRGGKIALETYALVVAGVSVDHPVVKKNFETLNSMSLDRTYNNACYAFALDAAISQLQNDAALAAPSQKLRADPSIGAAFRPRLEAAVNALVRLRRKTGGWNYTADHNRFDNSNTQFAVLGLGVGPKHGVTVPREVWEEIVQHFLQGQKKDGPEVAERPEFYPEDEKGEGKRDRINIVDKSGEKVEKVKPGDKKGRGEKEKNQERDGSPTVARKPDPQTKGELGAEALRYFARGWDYEHKGGETWNMTCGGLSSMILAEQNLRGQVPPDFHQKIQRSIRDGYAWLMRNWNFAGGGEWKYYGIYSLEKVADLGEVKKFGSHDWYQEVARHIISDQRADGSWPGGNGVQIRWNSAFALLILNRATSLITQGRSVKPGRMVLTGAVIRRDKEISDDRNWVYVPDYEREFHIPSILRQARLRPTVNLLRILELCLKHYPEETRGFLVWNLARAHDQQKIKSVRVFLEDQIAAIVGAKYDAIAKYELWYKRWLAVHKIGTEAKDADGYLAVCYPSTKNSLPLRKKIIWAVARCKEQKLAPLLLDDLAHADAGVRQAAYEALSLLRLSREPIPLFDSKADGPARDQQIAQIRDWHRRGTAGA